MGFGFPFTFLSERGYVVKHLNEDFERSWYSCFIRDHVDISKRTLEALWRKSSGLENMISKGQSRATRWKTHLVSKEGAEGWRNLFAERQPSGRRVFPRRGLLRRGKIDLWGHRRWWGASFWVFLVVKNWNEWRARMTLPLRLKIDITSLVPCFRQLSGSG